MTLGSLFDGIGGFPLAASRYGVETKWAGVHHARNFSGIRRYKRGRPHKCGLPLRLML